ncbi:MAG: hypothetical protein KZQ78_00305 [Candidatus Thiodiazotropha sp. (ex Ustalcina ferruginea)]|nr:hypothetical protein [Candidatus Thiodiazotropha sp. (ex Ustalcina ferruginea)]
MYLFLGRVSLLCEEAFCTRQTNVEFGNGTTDFISCGCQYLLNILSLTGLLIDAVSKEVNTIRNLMFIRIERLYL